jgi:oxaloacetate decarboxylase (Na+ extruding) subunit alpha
MNEPVLSLAEMRRKFPASITDDEFLLRAVMPAEQVDAMLAAGPARRHYNPDVRPLLSLLQELKRKPRVAQFVVEKPDFRLELRARAGTRH